MRLDKSIVASLSAVLCVSFAGPVLADATGHGPLLPLNDPKPVDGAPSRMLGLEFIPVPAITLGDVDLFQIYLEDDRAPQPAPLRVGVSQAVEATIGDGQWINVEGGRLWQLEISGTGSIFNRLHLTGVMLGPGEKLWLVSGNGADVAGPIEARGEFENGEAWGVFALGETSRIEWFVPDAADPQSLPFESVDYTHGYRDLFSTEAQEAGCDQDPACFAAWANEANAGARMLFTSGASSYYCSGQLMATDAADETPYFSTANHCISIQSEANSCQFLFNYRATTCGGATGTTHNAVGGDLVSTYATSDCTLLMVRATLPSNAFWAGWMSTNPATGVASTGIHFPGGRRETISFCNKAAASSLCGTSSQWSTVSWYSGVTEGGSSGSALYLDSDHKMYGVLTCGLSSCTNLTGKDGYGRWDRAVTTGGFSVPLAVGSDDSLEQNDTCATAKAVAPGTYSGLVVKRLDEDWYALTVPPTGTVTITETFVNGNGDIDTQLFDSCSGAALVTRNGHVNNDSFTYTNTTASSTILMRVYLYSDTRNDYSFSYSVSVPPPANNECATATPVGVGTTAFDSTYATNSALAVAAGCDGGTSMNKDVWFRFTAPSAGNATASTCGLANWDTRLVMYPGSVCPSSSADSIACNNDACGSASSVTWHVDAGSQWYIRLGSTANIGGTGSLQISVACDGDFDGSGEVDSGDVGLMLLDYGNCPGCSSDLDGDGVVDGSDMGLLLLGFGPC
ncbi:MAG: hypothetical protein K8R92_01790 [Planctomycetes bacterium]|nr:hypothetical protein [Planctomycetota bacterium]